MWCFWRWRLGKMSCARHWRFTGVTVPLWSCRSWVLNRFTSATLLGVCVCVWYLIWLELWVVDGFVLLRVFSLTGVECFGFWPVASQWRWFCCWCFFFGGGCGVCFFITCQPAPSNSILIRPYYRRTVVSTPKWSPYKMVWGCLGRRFSWLDIFQSTPHPSSGKLGNTCLMRIMMIKVELCQYHGPIKACPQCRRW